MPYCCHLKLEILSLLRVGLSFLNKVDQFRIRVRRKQREVIDIVFLLEGNIKAKRIKDVGIRVTLSAKLRSVKLYIFAASAPSVAC